MGGIEALRLIRSANPRQLVVLMTAFGTAQTAIEAMKYGAFDYVMKPFDPPKVGWAVPHECALVCSDRQ